MADNILTEKQIDQNSEKSPKIETIVQYAADNIMNWLDASDGTTFEEFRGFNNGFRRGMIQSSWSSLLSFLSDRYDMLMLEAISDHKQEIIDDILEKIDDEEDW